MVLVRDTKAQAYDPEVDCSWLLWTESSNLHHKVGRDDLRTSALSVQACEAGRPGWDILGRQK